MFGAPLSEVWSDYKPEKKDKKKKRKNKPLSPDEMDSGLLVKQSERPVLQNENVRERLSLLRDDREDDYMYERINVRNNPNVVTIGDPYGERDPPRKVAERPSRIEDDPDYQEFLEYKRNKNSLKRKRTENRVAVEKDQLIDPNDQLNELLLYVFTGFFLLILYDNIYRLGKKSY